MGVRFNPKGVKKRTMESYFKRERELKNETRRTWAGSNTKIFEVRASIQRTEFGLRKDPDHFPLKSLVSQIFALCSGFRIGLKIGSKD